MSKIVFDPNAPYITLFSKNLKKSKPDIRNLNVKVSHSGSTLIFDLSPVTNRTFTRMDFVIAPGCSLVYDGNEYITTDIHYADHPRYVTISARRVA